MFKIYLVLTVLATGADGTQLKQMHIHEAPSEAVCIEKVDVISAKLMSIKNDNTLFGVPYTNGEFTAACITNMFLSVNGMAQ